LRAGLVFGTGHVSLCLRGQAVGCAPRLDALSYGGRLVLGAVWWESPRSALQRSADEALEGHSSLWVTPRRSIRSADARFWGLSARRAWGFEAPEDYDRRASSRAEGSGWPSFAAEVERRCAPLARRYPGTSSHLSPSGADVLSPRTPPFRTAQRMRENFIPASVTLEITPQSTRCVTATTSIGSSRSRLRATGAFRTTSLRVIGRYRTGA